MALEFTTVNILYVTIGLFLIGFAIDQGWIKLGQVKSRITHTTAKHIHPRLHHPDFGELHIIGGVEINGKTHPITEEYGPDVPMPFTMDLFKNVFPASMKKFMLGDPDGQLLYYIDENYPFSSEMRALTKMYNRRDDELIVRNQYLEKQVKKLKSEQDEDMRQTADLVGDIKKKLYTVIPDPKKPGGHYDNQ